MAEKTEEQKRKYALKRKETDLKNAELIKEKRKKKYRENREAELEKARRYREANPEKVKESQMKYVEKAGDALKERKKKWNIENADKVKAYTKYHNDKNNKINYERRKEAMTERRKNDPEYRERCNQWAKKNKAKRCMYTAMRRSIKLKATPKWLTDEEKEQIKEIYEESARLTKETGIQHNVDHIVPLRGKYVCGLHVPWNLQILTALENMRKGTSY